MTPEERLKFFVDRYDLIAGGFFGKGPKRQIGNKNNPKCRFCFRDKTETTFKNVAHAIPEFLGNHQLILLDECDECNTFFSENLEDHLDKYTKPFRTISQIKGKNKVPSYKSRDKKSRIDVDESLIIKSQIDSRFIQDNNDNNQFTMRMDFEPHIPVAVYKAIVKIAISIIENEEELKAFIYTIAWIKDNDHSKAMLHPLKIWTTFIPGPRPNPMLTTMLFRRKNGCEVPYSVFLIAFSNFIYQVIIPSHLDGVSGSKITFSLPYFPSSFEYDWPYGKLKYGLIDMSDTKKVSKTEPIIMHYNKKVEVPIKNKKNLS